MTETTQTFVPLARGATQSYREWDVTVEEKGRQLYCVVCEEGIWSVLRMVSGPWNARSTCWVDTEQSVDAFLGHHNLILED